MNNIQRGDIFFADLNPVVGSEQGGVRPVVVIQNDKGNKYSPTIIAAITSRTAKKKLPTHVDIEPKSTGLMEDSIVMLEQVRTIDKTRLIRKLGHLNEASIQQINHAIDVSFGCTHKY